MVHSEGLDTDLAADGSEGNSRLNLRNFEALTRLDVNCEGVCWLFILKLFQ
jgi:hypothetical protein